MLPGRTCATQQVTKGCRRLAEKSASTALVPSHVRKNSMILRQKNSRNEPRIHCLRSGHKISAVQSVCSMDGRPFSLRVRPEAPSGRAFSGFGQFWGLRARSTGTPMIRIAAPAHRISSFISGSLSGAFCACCYLIR